MTEGRRWARVGRRIEPRDRVDRGGGRPLRAVPRAQLTGGNTTTSPGNTRSGSPDARRCGSRSHTRDPDGRDLGVGDVGARRVRSWWRAGARRAPTGCRPARRRRRARPAASRCERARARRVERWRGRGRQRRRTSRYDRRAPRWWTAPSATTCRRRAAPALGTGGRATARRPRPWPRTRHRPRAAPAGARPSRTARTRARDPATRRRRRRASVPPSSHHAPSERDPAQDGGERVGRGRDPQPVVETGERDGELAAGARGRRGRRPRPLSTASTPTVASRAPRRRANHRKCTICPIRAGRSRAPSRRSVPRFVKGVMFRPAPAGERGTHGARRRDHHHQPRRRGVRVPVAPRGRGHHLDRAPLLLQLRAGARVRRRWRRRPATTRVDKLASRALWWFRWAAVATLVTGIMILLFQTGRATRRSSSTATTSRRRRAWRSTRASCSRSRCSSTSGW